jgi:TRAP-type C4-dicarboxylate transport system substrate-binding protein
MRVARRAFLASAAVSLAAPAIMRFARADAPITLKLHHSFSSVSSVHDKFLAPWARKVATDSGGRIRIDIFPSMQLGGAPAQLFDQARDGVADIAWVAPSWTPGRFPKAEMFELPFLPSRRALVSSKALQDFAAANLKDEFSEIYPICFSCSDRAVVHTNQAVRTIEDIKDMKLHVQTRLAGDAMRVLGAQPVPMPNAQLPLAITGHVVDGCVDPWNLVPTYRLNDLLKMHTEFSDSSLSSTTFVLAMNREAYDRLPRELKTVIDSNSGQPAAGLAGAMWDIQANAVVQMVVDRGDVIVTLLPEAVAHWRKATEPVIEAWQKDMKEKKVDGGKLLASARALLAKYVNEPEPTPPQSPPPQQDAVTQPQPEAKADVNAGPKINTPAAQPPAPAAKPVVKPAAGSAPAPATPTPSMAPAARSAPLAAAPAPHVAAPTLPASAPSPAPTPTPPKPAAPVARSAPPVTPPAPPVVKPVAPPAPATPVASSAPVPVAPMLPHPPPVPAPAAVTPPKALDIPL